MKWFFAKNSKQVFAADGDMLAHYEGKPEYVELDKDTALELESLAPAERSILGEAAKPAKKSDKK
jgi:hypothetical protein